MDIIRFCPDIADILTAIYDQCKLKYFVYVSHSQ